MWVRQTSCLIAVFVFLVDSTLHEVLADNPASWGISEQTMGEDVFWTSPTAVDVGFPLYEATYEITRVEAFAGGIGFDVTDQIPQASGTVLSPSLPITLLQETVSDPISGTSATVEIGVNSVGLGQASITDVVLGQVTVIIPISITRIEVDANLSILGAFPGDTDGDGVDAEDYFTIRDNMNSTVSGRIFGDVTGDGLVSLDDFLEWKNNAPVQALAAAGYAIPEPTTLGLLTTLGLGMCRCRTRRCSTAFGSPKSDIMP